ncbi:atlastin-2-like [Brachionichthys hirsutus]|uniref:atlastin-2-like n=1 Tax=Brachionichthys hirsutus TaxID=412623 RepID=UPI003604650E
MGRPWAMYVAALVTGFVGVASVATLCNLVMGVALTALCIWAHVRYSGQFREVGGVIDQVAGTLWEQRTVGKVFSKLFEVARSLVPLGGLVPAPRPRLASNNFKKKD